MKSLFTMLHESSRISRAHGISRALHELQAEALEIPMTFGSATWEEYERAFKEQVSGLKAAGVEAGVFGDIDLPEHREWVERVCGEMGIAPLLPLWGEDHTSLAREFAELGFHAVIVSVKRELLGAEWLGRDFDLRAIEGLEEVGVDPSGEGGEFHTFVFDGPLFRRCVGFSMGEIKERDGYLGLELHPA